ncbi:MAG TPA: cysteine hydrolase family protein [Geobacteraceae bacterium]
MNSCLLIIDLQNDYFAGGPMELVGIDEAAANARLLLDEFRKKGAPVVHIRHISTRQGATFFLPDTDGSKINPMVAPWEEEPVMVKNYPNSFRGTALSEWLRQRGVDTLVVCGAMSHMCIDATVRAAFDLGFNCIVAHDACAARDLAFTGVTVKAADVHASFMAALSAVFARVISAKEIIESIMIS